MSRDAGSSVPVPADLSVGGGPRVRVILADSQVIYRVGISKIFTQQPDIAVLEQADSFAHALAAVQRLGADVLLFEERLSPTPADAIAELLRHAPNLKVVVLTGEPDEQQTIEYLKRGVRGIITRSITPELLVRCVRKVAEGEVWLDNTAINWMLRAYRSQAEQLAATSPISQLTHKEVMIVAGVAQGLRNRDIADKLGTTEQVIKNYLRKIYDKLGVGDRLELALFCLQKNLMDADPDKAKAAASTSERPFLG